MVKLNLEAESDMDDKTEKREKWIDTIKGLAIICVVLGHAIDGIRSAAMYTGYERFLRNLEDIISTFHMPLFITVSGYLYAKVYLYKSLSKKKEKIINFILLYLEWCFLWYIFKTISGKLTISGTTIKDLISIPIRSIGVYWYLYILILLYIFMEHIVQIIGRHNKLALTIFVIFNILYNKFVWGGQGECLDDKITAIRLIYYLLFFYYGYLIQRDEKIKKNILNNKYFVLNLFIIIAWFIAEFKFSILFEKINILKPFIIILIINIIFYLTILFNECNLVVLHYLGKNSLEIYLLHRFFLLVVRHAINWMHIDSMILGLSVITIVGITGPLIISFILKVCGLWEILFSPFCFVKAIKKG